MSDEAGVATAPPVESPSVPATEPVTEAAVETAPEIQLEAGTSKAALRRNAIKRGQQASAQRAVAEAARERARGQPRVEAGQDGGGQFTAEGGELEPTAPVDAPAAEAPGAGSTVDTTAQADTAPAGDTVDIPLPDGHPLRDRGKTFIRALKSEEAEIRNGVNAAVRARRLEQENEQLLRDKALMEARQQVLSGDFVQYEKDPKYAALLDQIRGAEGFGDEMAERVLAGLQALESQKIRDAEQQADSQLGVMRTTQQFVGEVEIRAGEVLKVWGDNNELSYRMPPLIQQYLQAVDRRNEREGRVTNPSINEFFQYISPSYRKDPRVGAQIEQVKATDAERERARIRAEVKAEMEREAQAKAAEAAGRRAALPPTARAVPARPSPATPPVPPEYQRPMSAAQRKRELRQQAAERGRGYTR